MAEKLAYIINSNEQYDTLFSETQGWDKADSIWGANLVVFTGGADVSPSLYGEGKLSGTNTTPARDKFETYAYNTALEYKIPMVGICRGAQFLNVMNNGRLWQNVDGHAIGGEHDLVDPDTGLVLHGVGVTSTHHQMMRQTQDAKVIAIARESSWKTGAEEYWNKKDSCKYIWDIEVVWYEQSNCLCFQPHPEFPEAYSCRRYFFELLDKYIQ